MKKKSKKQQLIEAVKEDIRMAGGSGNPYDPDDRHHAEADGKVRALEEVLDHINRIFGA